MSQPVRGGVAAPDTSDSDGDSDADSDGDVPRFPDEVIDVIDLRPVPLAQLNDVEEVKQDIKDQEVEVRDATLPLDSRVCCVCQDHMGVHDVALLSCCGAFVHQGCYDKLVVADEKWTRFCVHCNQRPQPKFILAKDIAAITEFGLARVKCCPDTDKPLHVSCDKVGCRYELAQNKKKSDFCPNSAANLRKRRRELSNFVLGNGADPNLSLSDLRVIERQLKRAKAEVLRRMLATVVE